MLYIIIIGAIISAVAVVFNINIPVLVCITNILENRERDQIWST